MRESTFTRPSTLCPHPERWNSHDDMATEVEVLELVHSFVRALQPDTVVETGTHRGFGAHSIGVALVRNGQGHLWTTELDPALVAEARDRCAGLPVTITEGSSLDFTPPGPIDFAWFDSDIDLRVPEFQRYHPFMHHRTVVGFHDTAPHHLLRPQLVGLPLDLLDLPTPRGVTFGRLRETA